MTQILTDADAVCEAVCTRCHPQALFEEYLRVGYYPFFDGDEQEYYSRIENVVSFIIDQEMTQFCGVEASYTRKLKAMMLFLANNLPYDVNIAKLSSYLELNKITVLNYLSSMKRAELLHLLYGLSPTTLKRFCGYLKNEEVQTRLYTLDVLARFVDLPFMADRRQGSKSLNTRERTTTRDDKELAKMEKMMADMGTEG